MFSTECKDHVVYHPDTGTNKFNGDIFDRIHKAITKISLLITLSSDFASTLKS